MVFSYSDKLYIYNKLNQITDLQQMNNVLKIVIKYDKNNIIENDKGTYIKLSNLKDKTYNELYKFINQCK